MMFSPEELSFPPFEFVAQDFKVGLPRRLDEFECLLCASDANAIGGLQRNAFLAIESEEDGFRVTR